MIKKEKLITFSSMGSGISVVGGSLVKKRTKDGKIETHHILNKKMTFDWRTLSFLKSRRERKRRVESSAHLVII